MTEHEKALREVNTILQNVALDARRIKVSELNKILHIINRALDMPNRL
jgi:hypothetical protein